MDRVLTADNYAQGFLIDEELMGGVSDAPPELKGASGQFLAYVLRHTTGEYLGHQTFARLDDALASINAVRRDWEYERAGGCGGGNCKAGLCSQAGTCGKRDQLLGVESSECC